MGGVEATTRTLLPEADAEFLDQKGYRWDVGAADGFINLVIHEFPLPRGYQVNRTSLLIRLPAGYPNSNPDMFWTHPDVVLVNGSYPVAADQHDVQYQGHGWQRWSRHFSGLVWRPGVDNIRSYLVAVRHELEKPVK